MKTDHLIKLQKELKNELDKGRYRHTIGVMYTAASLAMCFDEDLYKAQIAGLLHDCAKCIPNDRKIRICKENKIQVTKLEYREPYLLHSKLGEFLARKKYKIKDEDILNAIRWHTTGRPGMSKLEKIIFIADYIEPNRTKAEHLDEIRHIAFQDLDQAMFRILEDTLEYLNSGKGELDPMSLDAYEYYREYIWKKQE